MVRPLVLACVVALGALLGAPEADAAELSRLGGLYPGTGPALPMVDSSIEVTVRGPLLEVVVTQRFHNRADHATEATYIFPLPTDAAVSAMWIKTGTKTIRAAIAKRADAQRRYEDAVRAGVTAAVLEQERPDIFTQTVAGIPPRSTVEVTLRYDALAQFYDGAWGLVIPMVVAPRYVPGIATARPTTGTGRAPDTDRAPDASRVTPGGAPGAGGATRVTIQFVDRVRDVTSPTHELAVSGQRATFTDPRSDHDAILRWRTASAAGWAEQGPKGGFAAVVVEAPPAPTRRGKLRCMLVLDRSAASRGDADAIAQPFVRQLLGALTAQDRVAVTGSDQLAWSVPADVARALDQRWTTQPGAFDLTRVLAAARPDGAPLVLVTGGLVADDRAAIAAAKRLGVPLHVIGVGPAPARGLLVQLATATGGTVRFALPGDDLPAIARAVIADAAHPPAPLTVRWGTLVASDIVPGSLPRLGTGQAMLVLARVRRAQPANARVGGEVFAIETLGAPRAVDGATTAAGPLARRWARSRLDELVATHASPAAVTALALEFGLVSPTTSMVAIGEQIVVEGGTRRSVAVPVSVPSGMRWQAVRKETTVDVSTATGGEDRDGRTKQQRARQPGTSVAGTTPRLPIASGPAPTTPTPEDVEDEEDARMDGADDDAPRSAPAPDVALGRAMSETSEISSTGLSVRGRRLRLTTSFGGGVVRAGGSSAPLLALATRLEVGGTTMLGTDLALWLADVGGDTDAQGRALLSIALRGVSRWVELGGGVGVHFGAGAGPAGSLGLRLHLPPAPRAAAYLRYDGALLLNDGASRGQHALTLGLEWGF